MTEGDPTQLTKLAQLASSGIVSFKEGLKKVALPLQKAGLFGVVLSFKEVVNKVVFNCPQRHYQLYSLMFMFAPAVLLFCLALMVSRNFWKMVAGCCRLRRPQQRVVWQQSRKYVFLSIVPPTAWILLALFDVEYYICAKLGSKHIRLNNTAPFQHPALLAEYETAKIESRMIAIFLLIGIALVGTVLISIERCCTRPDTGISDDEEYTYFLAEEQIKLFNSKLEPLAKGQAKVEVEALFERFKDVDDIAEKVRLISEELQNEIPWAATHEEPIFISTILQSVRKENLAHYFPYDVKPRLLAHSRSFFLRPRSRFSHTDLLLGEQELNQTRETVFQRDIQTPRRELKIRPAAKVFSTKFEVFG